MSFNYKLILGMLTTILLLVFITIKMDCERLGKDIIRLNKQNQIITDNIHSLKMKENQLMSQNRIEKIAIEQLGMYSPLPESLVVVLK